MRISDWSSDVCSSDLIEVGGFIGKFGNETASLERISRDGIGSHNQQRPIEKPPPIGLAQNGSGLLGDHRHTQNTCDRSAFFECGFACGEDRKSKSMNTRL